jgi:hypothetical protein
MQVLPANLVVMIVDPIWGNKKNDKLSRSEMPRLCGGILTAWAEPRD